MEKLLLPLYAPSPLDVVMWQSINGRQLQSICRRREVHSLWSIVKLTKLLRKKLEELPFQQPMLNTKPRNDITHMSIVLVTQII